MAQAARPLPAGPSPQRPPLRVVPPPRGPQRPPAAVIRRRRLSALLGLALLVALPVVTIRALGGPGDARGEITRLLERGSARPDSLCDHLSTNLLAAAGGRAACLRASPPRGPSAEVRQVRVEGGRATAVLRSSDGDERISLVRQDGDWKVDDVR